MKKFFGFIVLVVGTSIIVSGAYFVMFGEFGGVIGLVIGVGLIFIGAIMMGSN